MFKYLYIKQRLRKLILTKNKDFQKDKTLSLKQCYMTAADSWNLTYFKFTLKKFWNKIQKKMKRILNMINKSRK